MFFTNLIVIACIISLRMTAAETNITGELKQWHKVTLTVDGPFAHESDGLPNPFLDYRMTVTFTHESGSPLYRVLGYFAADGNAAQTSATAGNKWRAHLSPDKPGRWNYEVSLLAGKRVAVDDEVARQASPVLHTTGSFDIAPTDKSGRDFRGKVYVVYLLNGDSAELNLSDDTTIFRVQWFNPRESGPLQSGSVSEVKGPGAVWLGQPPAEADQDWVALIRK